MLALVVVVTCSCRHVGLTHCLPEGALERSSSAESAQVILRVCEFDWTKHLQEVLSDCPDVDGYRDVAEDLFEERDEARHSTDALFAACRPQGGATWLERLGEVETRGVKDENMFKERQDARRNALSEIERQMFVIREFVIAAKREEQLLGSATGPYVIDEHVLDVAKKVLENRRTPVGSARSGRAKLGFGWIIPQ